MKFWEQNNGVRARRPGQDLEHRQLVDRIIVASPEMPDSEGHKIWLLGLPKDVLAERLRIIESQSHLGPSGVIGDDVEVVPTKHFTAPGMVPSETFGPRSLDSAHETPGREQPQLAI